MITILSIICLLPIVISIALFVLNLFGMVFAEIVKKIFAVILGLACIVLTLQAIYSPSLAMAIPQYIGAGALAWLSFRALMG